MPSPSPRGPRWTEVLDLEPLGCRLNLGPQLVSTLQAVGPTQSSGTRRKSTTPEASTHHSLQLMGLDLSSQRKGTFEDAIGGAPGWRGGSGRGACLWDPGPAAQTGSQGAGPAAASLGVFTSPLTRPTCPSV